MGRLLQGDPASFGGDATNLYRYCGNNPLTRSDASGLGYPGRFSAEGNRPSPGFGDGIDGINSAGDGATYVSNGISGIDVTGVSDVSVKQAESHYALTSGASGITVGNWFRAYGINTGPGGIATFSARNTPGFKGDGATNPNVQASLDYLSQYRPAADTIDLLRTSGSISISLNSSGDDSYDGAHTINWDANSELITTSGGVQSPALGLGHELGHAFFNFVNPTAYAALAGTAIGGGWTNAEEYRNITQFETPMAVFLGEPTRNDHLGTPEWTSSPIPLVND
jgi:hypothetical protein